MPDGSLLLVTAHEDASGYGPSLGEMARLMVSLGAADALNFDGGSSTTLVLDEQPLNRPGSSVARVHNGLAVFYRPEQAQRLP
jgi:exopolysaccharide biosynthesis protein